MIISMVLAVFLVAWLAVVVVNYFQPRGKRRKAITAPEYWPMFSVTMPENPNPGDMWLDLLEGNYYRGELDGWKLV